jgi:hypothetical protein
MDLTQGGLRLFKEPWLSPGSKQRLFTNTLLRNTFLNQGVHEQPPVAPMNA